jgi:ribose transport system substrate-binding protein
MGSRSRIAALLLGATLIGSGLAACGSSDDSSTSASTQGAGTEATSTPTTATDAAGSDLKAQVAKLMERPTDIGITEPIKGGMPKGLKIAYLQCALPDCIQIGDTLDAATKKIGWSLQRINTEGTPEGVKAAWQTALRDSPDAIIQSGSPDPSFYADELKQAQGKDIPFVGIAEPAQGSQYLASIGSGDPSPDTTDSYGFGQGKRAALVAAYMCEPDGCDTGYVNLTGIGITEAETKGFEAGLKEYCPDCDLKTVDVPVSAFGKDAPTRIASFLQANPNITMLGLPTIDLAIGLPQAIKGAGVTPPKIVSSTLDGPGIDLIKSGDVTATVAYPNTEGAYRALDAIARNKTGQDPAVDADATFPKWVITKDNLPADAKAPVPTVADYQQQFYKLWGIQ